MTEDNPYRSTIQAEAYFQKRPGLLLLFSGLATSAATLALLYVLDDVDLHVMGWYAEHILPAGAFLAGALAGSGYGLAAWLIGVRVRPSLLWTIALLQFGVYGAAQYLEYELKFVAMAPNAQLGFFEYYDLVTRSFAWKEQNQPQGQPLREWGYLLRLGEILGFVAGGVAMPAILRAKPYCDACQVYKRSRRLGFFAASAVPRKIKKKDVAGRAAFDVENQAAFTHALELSKQALTYAESAQVDKLTSLLIEHAQTARATKKHPIRVVISVESCPKCLCGHLVAKQMTGSGHQIKITELARAAIDPTFVRSFTLPGK